ncbi:hypothetical protein Ancab_030106 [Ancistrocladus abbreviatus]
MAGDGSQGVCSASAAEPWEVYIGSKLAYYLDFHKEAIEFDPKAIVETINHRGYGLWDSVTVA